MNVEPLGTADPPAGAPITRVYTGSYGECHAAMERDAAELAPIGYGVLSESYNVSWGAGICYGCLSVEFGQPTPDAAIASGDNPEPAQP